ncbi:hypothetical protein HY3_12545 [Hyphomonas pacifica]|uniref:Thiamine phosphate synthase/TenI domain-containing protein n=2 Tax=Hyphomonas pacifica TaxID=1280941 RepID=A0A062U3E5_9PROT|nr:hypothetical protein HY2_12445 [Hyphomonas pacifica]RAN33598.1 hypothetical protein HY3_12545 [Hyphomonas pacifica]RAN37042.1 hypothetical protein HY11_10565 [Hyphomonas pacifica]
MRHLPAGLPPALFLTDPKRTPDPLPVAEQLPQGWGIIYRHYGAADRAWQATQLVEIANRRGLDLLIAADPKLAMQVGAAGVHWPFAQLATARKWRTRFKLMTVSAHGGRELRRLDANTFDAALVSAVFPSNSPSASSPLGAHTLRALSGHTPLPLYALGGLNAQTASSISNAAGLAAIEGIVDAFER